MLLNPRVAVLATATLALWLVLHGAQAASGDLAASLATHHRESDSDSVQTARRGLSASASTAPTPFSSWATTKDAFQYIAAFLMVLLAAHPLGVMFPRYLKLPLITGYLIMGIVAGPFLTNLLPTALVEMLAPSVNALALSFISFQAGQEIYFPELKPQIKSILTLLLVLYGVTMVVLTSVLFAFNSLFFYGSFDGACQVAIALMFGSIAVLGSPATVMAIKIELNSVGPFTNLMLGATMTAEFVVLVSFSLSRVVSSVYCAKLDISLGNLMFTMGVVVANLLVGGVVAVLIVAIFAIPGGPEHDHESAELLVVQDRASHQGQTTVSAQQYISRSRSSRHSLRKLASLHSGEDEGGGGGGGGGEGGGVLSGDRSRSSVRGDLESAMSPISENGADTLPHPHNAYVESVDDDDYAHDRRKLLGSPGFPPLLWVLEWMGSLYGKGFLWLLAGYAFYLSTATISEATIAAYGHVWDVKLEPLLVLMTASCVAGHYATIRHDMHVILDTAAPYIFLPFFVITGAALELDQVANAIPLMSLYVVLRYVSIFAACYVGGRWILKLSPREYNNLWLTMTPQAGVALGLANEVKMLSEEPWAAEFAATIVAAVVVNQIIGPVLCAIGLRNAGETYASRMAKAMEENAAAGGDAAGGDNSVGHGGAFSVSSTKQGGEELHWQTNGDPRPLLPFYKVNNAVVIGEDETAFEVALELSLYGAHVHCPLLDEELAEKWHQINETILARSAKGDLITYKNKLRDPSNTTSFVSSASAAAGATGELQTMTAATDVVVFTGDPQRTIEHVKTMQATLGGRDKCPRLIAVIPDCGFAVKLKELGVLIIQPSIAMANIATRMALLELELAQQLSNEISTTSTFSTATYFMRRDDSDRGSVHSLSEMRLVGRRLALGRSVVTHHNVNYDQVAEALASSNLPLPPPPARVSMFGTSAVGHDPFSARPGGLSVYEHYAVDEADLAVDYSAPLPGEVFADQYLPMSPSEASERGRSLRRARASSRVLRRSRSASSSAQGPHSLRRNSSSRM